MKYILLATLIAIGLSSFGQQKPKAVVTKKKDFVWPKPIKDSIWYDVTCDTLFGKIEIKDGNSKIVGDGIIVDCMQWHYSEPVYSHKDRAKIDSFYKKQRDDFNEGLTIGFSVGMGASGLGTYQPKQAFLKTKEVYRRVHEEYTFIAQ